MNDSIKHHKFGHLFSSLYLILKIIVSFFSPLFLILLIDQSVREEKKADDHSEEIEHLSVKGHCPIEA
jgi:hypothetical protein